MHTGKFIDLTGEQQRQQVHNQFHFQEDEGWFTSDGIFAGRDEEEVIAALIDLEEAEINAIGDCMTGWCVVPPRLEDFVRKP